MCSTYLILKTNITTKLIIKNNFKKDVKNNYII